MAAATQGREARLGTGDGSERGGTAALAEAHLVLVAYAVAEVVSRVPRHVARAELESAGMLGLVQAATTWNAARGVPFARYASARIKGAVLDELRSADWASRSTRARARAVAATEDALTARLGHHPDDAQVARAAGLDAVALRRVQCDETRARLLSIEALADDGTEVALVDGAGPEQGVVDRERSEHLRDAVASLPPRLRTIVEGYYFGARALQDLAGELGVSPSRVSQLLAEALSLLRAALDPRPAPDADRKRRGRAARRRAAYLAAVHTAEERRRPAARTA